MTDLRLEALSAATATAANSLTLKPGQEQFVQPTTYGVAESDVKPSASWPRVVLDGDEVVGLIIGSFDAENPQEELQACIWRVNVSGTAQGRGVGRFAVHGLADEARKRGFERLTVVYEPGEGSPEDFFAAVGFEVVRETQYGDHFAVLTL
ncbi:GNAT family N-acetyltransferase [Microbacterium sp. M1A1_1b]|uniref:GNAT family N-acetyltransferase n=1 Tax=Curtobacterium sp. VKM Ac-2922 TaxID=2929475 RepID=UPI001FB443EE|nr:GNAT family N-acetyltransferase [Curtobacterium sp. VKM Ac-2922]MCJ1714587.1 GNAT family N-acetyltransferase [Curtobacterium sp. VKM Ac-2922]